MQTKPIDKITNEQKDKALVPSQNNDFTYFGNRH